MNCTLRAEAVFDLAALSLLQLKAPTPPLVLLSLPAGTDSDLLLPANLPFAEFLAKNSQLPFIRGRDLIHHLPHEPELFH